MKLLGWKELTCIQLGGVISLPLLMVGCTLGEIVTTLALFSGAFGGLLLARSIVVKMPSRGFSWCGVVFALAIGLFDTIFNGTFLGSAIIDVFLSAFLMIAVLSKEELHEAS